MKKGTPEYEQLKEDLKNVILNYLDNNKIDPSDVPTVTLHAQGMWRELDRGGYIQAGMTFDGFLYGLTTAGFNVMMESI